jgi:hypothetical protein
MKPAIDPDLKAFIDDLLVPMLVRDALKDIATENFLAPERSLMANSPSTDLRSARSAEEKMA